jgi:hypothetical protein
MQDFIFKSMFSHENDCEKESTQTSIQLLEKKVIYSDFPLEEYDSLVQCVKTHTNRKRKDFQKQLDELLSRFPNAEKSMTQIREQHETQQQIIELKESLKICDQFIEDSIETTLSLLQTRGFVEYSENGPQLTTLGVVASQLNEAEPLGLAKLIVDGLEMSTKQLAGLFSCFTDVRVENRKTHDFSCILSGFDCELHYVLVDYVMEWCDCETEEMCKQVIQRIEIEGIFLGDFVKALLKIVNIAREVEKVSIYLNIPLMESVSKVPSALMKYIINNQSLYI